MEAPPRKPSFDVVAVVVAVAVENELVQATLLVSNATRLTEGLARPAPVDE